MEDLGRLLAALGFVIVGVGAIVWCCGRAGFQELPVDVVEESQRVRPFVLIGSSLLLSVVLSAAMFLMQWVGRR
jgi:hypothetical protein